MSLGPSPSPERATLLEAARVYLGERLQGKGATVTPSDLMRQLNLGWNTAASLLEHLEKAGELVRLQGEPVLTWNRAERAAPVVGSMLSLSPAEQEALLALLSNLFADGSNSSEPFPRHLPYLRAVQRRLKEASRA